MKVLIKAVFIRNEWDLHSRFKGLRGLLRRLMMRLRGRRLERALGIRIKVGGEPLGTLDLSQLEGEGANYVIVPPVICDHQEKIQVQVIPRDADLAPNNIQIVFTRME